MFVPRLSPLTAVCVVLAALSAGCMQKTGVTVSPVRSDVPLVAAAHAGDERRLEAQLVHGAMPDAKDKRGRTALMEAASMNHVTIVEGLLKKGADPAVKDNGGSTALLIAASSGNTASVKALLDHGADVNGRGWDDRTPLVSAVENNINKGFEDRPGVDYPVELLDTEELLLSRGADVHASDEKGRTALSIAEERGVKKTIGLLKSALSAAKPIVEKPDRSLQKR